MYEWHHNSATSPASSPGGWRSPAGVLQPEEPSSASQVTKLMLEGILDQLETDRTRRMSLSPSFHASYSLSASSADRLTRRAADAARDHLADRTDVSADHQQHLAATPRRELNASSVSASSERLAALEASVTTLTNLLAPLQKQWRDDRSLNQSRRSDSDALPLLLEEVRSLKDQIRRQQQQQQPAADAGRKAGHPLPPLVNSSAPRRRAQPHDVAAFGAAASLGEPSAAAGAASLSWTTMRTPSPAKRGVRLVEPGFLSAADLSNISRIEFDGLALYRPRLRQCIAANAILRLSDNKVAFLHADDRSLICEAPVAHLVEAELRGPSCFVQVVNGPAIEVVGDAAKLSAVSRVVNLEVEAFRTAQEASRDSNRSEEYDRAVDRSTTHSEPLAPEFAGKSYRSNGSFQRSVSASTYRYTPQAPPPLPLPDDASSNAEAAPSWRQKSASSRRSVTDPRSGAKPPAEVPHEAPAAANEQAKSDESQASDSAQAKLFSQYEQEVERSRLNEMVRRREREEERRRFNDRERERREQREKELEQEVAMTKQRQRERERDESQKREREREREKRIHDACAALTDKARDLDLQHQQELLALREKEMEVTRLALQAKERETERKVVAELAFNQEKSESAQRERLKVEEDLQQHKYRAEKERLTALVMRRQSLDQINSQRYEERRRQQISEREEQRLSLEKEMQAVTSVLRSESEIRVKQAGRAQQLLAEEETKRLEDKQRLLSSRLSEEEMRVQQAQEARAECERKRAAAEEAFQQAEKKKQDAERLQREEEKRALQERLGRQKEEQDADARRQEQLLQEQRKMQGLQDQQHALEERMKKERLEREAEEAAAKEKRSKDDEEVKQRREREEKELNEKKAAVAAEKETKKRQEKEEKAKAAKEKKEREEAVAKASAEADRLRKEKQEAEQKLVEERKRREEAELAAEKEKKARELAAKEAKDAQEKALAAKKAEEAEAARNKPVAAPPPPQVAHLPPPPPPGLDRRVSFGAEANAKSPRPRASQEEVAAVLESGEWKEKIDPKGKPYYIRSSDKQKQRDLAAYLASDDGKKETAALRASNDKPTEKREKKRDKKGSKDDSPELDAKVQALLDGGEWKEKTDNTGRKYYVQKETKKRVWDLKKHLLKGEAD